MNLFTANKFSNKSFSFESKQFFLFVFCFSSSGGVALIAFSINHCSIVRQKEFSRKTEDTKIKSFSWNEFSSDNSCFESEQFFKFYIVWLLSGAFTLRQDESQHYGKNTKVIFWKMW